MNKFISLFVALFIITVTACAPNVTVVCPSAHEEPSVAPSASPMEGVAPPAASSTETEVLTSIPTSPGLIRMIGTQLYAWFGRDGLRHVVVPNSVELLSWGLDTSDARIVDATTWYEMRIGSAIQMRPGTFPVRINTEDYQYAVGYGGVLHLLWTDRPGYASFAEVQDIYHMQSLPTIAVRDWDFIYYRIGLGITANSARVPDGTVFIFSDDNTRRYVAWQGTMRPIASTQAFEANRFEETFIVTTNAHNRSAYTLGTPITGYEPLLSDPAGALHY